MFYKTCTTVVHQAASILSSTIGIAWAMASYHKNVRIAFEERKNIGNVGTFLQFVWHISITGKLIYNIFSVNCFKISSIQIYTYYYLYIYLYLFL